MNISPKKLKSLPEKQQHSHIAKLLREVYEESMPETFEELSNLYHHHLQKAERSLKEHNLLPSIFTQDQPSNTPPLPIAIYLDHIRSAHNVGSILRTTEALRLGQVYLSEQTPGPEHKQVQDTSMGAHKWVHCQHADLTTLPRPIIALETIEDAAPLYNFPFPETFTLVVGNEEYGCSEETLQLADHVLQIPLYGTKNSLNVANCFAIVAAEIRKKDLGGG